MSRNGKGSIQRTKIEEIEMKEEIRCQKCGDFVCSDCGIQRQAVKVPIIKNRQKSFFVQGLQIFAALGSLALLGSIVKLCYIIFVWGWGLFPSP